MLEACGFAAEEPWAAIIGTDWSLRRAGARLGRPATQPHGPHLLAQPVREGWRLRSPLERYDHEHAFRVEIAPVAQQQTGDPTTDPHLLVESDRQRGMSARCQWWEHCRPQLDPDDVSLRIDKAPLDMREIATLRRHGISTITDLVDAELDELAELVSARSHPSRRGRRAGSGSLPAGRGCCWTAAPSSGRPTGPIDGARRPTVEIDLDIESSADGRVYLWGFLVQHAGETGRGLSRVQPVR